jgi:hypothetical protein
MKKYSSGKLLSWYTTRNELSKSRYQMIAGLLYIVSEGRSMDDELTSGTDSVVQSWPDLLPCVFRTCRISALDQSNACLPLSGR